MELEDEKRALALSPGAGEGSSTGFSSRRRLVTGNANHDSPRSHLSGSSSMYTDEKGLTERIGGVNIVGNKAHMLLGGDAAAAQQLPRDFLDNDEEMSV